MESTDVSNMMNVVRKTKVWKPYVAPRLQRLSTDVVKVLLSREAEKSDTEFRQLIESVDHLHGAKGS